MDVKILEKDVGPFPVGVWLIVIGGGIVLAIVIRKSLGGHSGGSSDDEGNVIRVLPEQSIRYPEVGQYLSPDTADKCEAVGGGSTQPVQNSPSVPKASTTPPTPVIPPKPPTTPGNPSFLMINPLIVKPGASVDITGVNLGKITEVAFNGYKSSTVTHVSESKITVVTPPTAKGAGIVVGTWPGGYKTTAPVPITFLATPVAPNPPTVPPRNPPAPPPAQDTVPGGFPIDCTGVGAVPPDYAQRRVMDSSAFNNRAVKTGWSLFNVAGPQPLGSDLNGLNVWLSTSSSWPLANTIRRSRGLKALTTSQWRQVSQELTTLVGTVGQSHLKDTHILAIWDKWNTPFLCNKAVPRAMAGGSKIGDVRK